MASSLIRPTNKAGEFVIPALGKTVQLVEWREDDFFDTVTRAAGAIAAGAKHEFFRDINNKNGQHCNITTPRRIPSGSEMVMNRLGLLIHQAVGNTIVDGGDITKVAYAGYFLFKLNTTRIIAEGPVVKFQSGLGVAGSTTQNATAYVTLGVPSLAAAPQLVVAQPIKDDDDLMGSLTFDDAAWITNFAMPTLAGAIAVTTFLHGLIKRPQGK